MYIRKDDMKPFEKKIWLASPTMHGDELEYVTEAYETNWMSTVGANINEVERIAAESAEVKYAVALSSCTAALHLCVKLAGERLYGKPAIGHGALEGKKVFCSDVTFDATLNPVVYEGGIPHEPAGHHRGRYPGVHGHADRLHHAPAAGWKLQHGDGDIDLPAGHVRQRLDRGLGDRVYHDYCDAGRDQGL